MAKAKVEVKFSHPHEKFDVGDTAELDTLEAKTLVRAGVATYATKADATKAEGDAGAEKTAGAVKKAAQRT